MTKDELIKTIKDLQKTKEDKEKELENVQNEVTRIKKDLEGLSVTLDSYKDELFANMRDEHLKTFTAEGYTSAILTRNKIEYKNEKAIIEWLKNNNYDNLIKTKITQSLDKTPFKKELKINESLQSNLKDYIKTGEEEYIIVTTTPKYFAMMEHIKHGN